MSVLLLALPPGARAGDARSADLVLVGGTLVTMDERQPRAGALASRGGRIVAVGGDAEVRRWIGPKTRVIDLTGATAVPGFIEGHAHFISLGRAKKTLDLSTARNWAHLVQLVGQAARTAAPGRWILGRGWHQAKWDRRPAGSVQGYPTHHELSRATPANPVILTHASGHMCLANAKAMELARVDRSTRPPRGGQIVRDAKGNPTGVFRETARALVWRAYDAARSSRPAGSLDEAIRTATDECLANGITTFVDAGSPLATIDHFARLARQGRLKVRLWVMINEPNAVLTARLPAYRIIGLGHNHLTVRAIKRFVDGALGTHGAWLLEPYRDLPQSTGLNVTPLESIRQTARLALKHGFQLCVHAIGDRANRQTLDLFAEVFRQHPRKTGLRWRIEHAQHLSPADIPRFGQLGVIAAMQGIHCTSDAPFVVRRLGARRARQGAYAWGALLKAGAVVINGTDAPVEDVSPLACFHASVTRRCSDGTTFFGEQRMTREQALRSYTLSAAYALFEEKLKGSLTVGKLADVAVLSEDILTIPARRIRQVRVLYTIVGGRVLYERPPPTR